MRSLMRRLRPVDWIALADVIVSIADLVWRMFGK